MLGGSWVDIGWMLSGSWVDLGAATYCIPDFRYAISFSRCATQILPTDTIVCNLSRKQQFQPAMLGGYWVDIGWTLNGYWVDLGAATHGIPDFRYAISFFGAAPIKLNIPTR